MMEWTHLPKCERHSGFGTKLNICVGCEGYITHGDHSHFFLFREIGYALDGTSFSPCGNQYHPECIKVVKPFKTRLVRATYPPAITHFPFFCEACTIRAVLGRELTAICSYRCSNGCSSAIWRTLGLCRYCREKQGNSVGSAILGRNTASNFPKGPDNPVSPVGCHSFDVGRIGVHSPNVPKNGRRDQVQHCQGHPVSGLCLPPLGENAPIPRSHVPG
jgi:hypothetical protein